MNVAVPFEAVATREQIVGNQLISVDVDAAGDESCLRSSLDFESPEHALAWMLLTDRPDFLILASEGKINNDTVEKMVAAIRKLKIKKQLEEAGVILPG